MSQNENKHGDRGGVLAESQAEKLAASAEELQDFNADCLYAESDPTVKGPSLKCPSCGASNAPGMAYCGKCGNSLHKQSPESESHQPEITNRKKIISAKLIVICVVVVAIIACVAALALSQTVFSQKAKADALFENGSYEEAIKLYNDLEQSDEVKTKIKTCHYNLFLEFLTTGRTSYSTSEGSNTWKVEGFSNGDIKISASLDYDTKYTTLGTEHLYVITIHRDNSIAEFTASEKTTILSLTYNESGSGKLDMASYKYGKDITLDSYTNSGSTTNSMIKSNSGVVTNMIQKGLVQALNASGTGCGLDDLGFASL